MCFNIYLFLQEELEALSFTFADGVEPGQLIQAFSATIDTAAWVILLLMFELETAVLNDRNIHGLVKWGLHGLRGIVLYRPGLRLYRLLPGAGNPLPGVPTGGGGRLLPGGRRLFPAGRPR